MVRFHGTSLSNSGGDATGDVSLSKGEHDERRHESDENTGREPRRIGAVLIGELGDRGCDGAVGRVLDEHQLDEQIAP